MTDSAGTVISETRYTAWGEVRYSSANSPTNYTYTGQYSEGYIKLLNYVSRRYDPELGLFIQPDTIVPITSQGVQAFNRYAYANNNPLRYTDPNGHYICESTGEDGKCNRVPTSVKQLKLAFRPYGVKVKGGWSFENLNEVYSGVISTGESLAQASESGNGQSAFKETFNSVTFEWTDRTCEINGYTCYADAYQPGTIRVWASYWSQDAEGNRFTRSTPVSPQLIVHELGHKFNVAVERGPENHVAGYVDGNGAHVLTDSRDGFASGYTFGQDNSGSEIFADMFVGWVYGAWANNDAGRTRNNVMTTNMTDWTLDAQNGQ